jgi:NAD(P)-dependent dehydrogenase (short-subunit alcohol dehydrogenase family)
MTRSEFKDRYIINVTSVEGLFSHLFKREAGTHPHTNMAKSALNMLTVTVAPNYAEKYSVYMCAVDPGWISQQSPYPTAQNIKIEKNFVVPLDETDAASRILDPVFSGINDEQYYIASLLKNYEKSSW